MNNTDADHMRWAIAAAMTSPTLPFGAAIVRRKTGEFIAQGTNRTQESPTFHAEIDAINRCAIENPGIDWKGLALYATAEPCPMCQGAIEFAGISYVCYGTSIPWLRERGWWQINLRAADVAERSPSGGARLVGGVSEAECNALFKRSRLAD